MENLDTLLYGLSGIVLLMIFAYVVNPNSLPRKWFRNLGRHQKH